MENNETHSSSMFGLVTVCAALLAASPSWAQALQYNPYGYTYPNSYAYGYGYGYPYSDYSYDYGNPLSIVTAPIAAATALAAPVAEAATAPFGMAAAATTPMVTGRSVATGQMGRMCSTPAKSCELYHASWVGERLFVPGIRRRGVP